VYERTASKRAKLYQLGLLKQAPPPHIVAQYRYKAGIDPAASNAMVWTELARRGDIKDWGGLTAADLAMANRRLIDATTLGRQDTRQAAMSAADWLELENRPSCPHCSHVLMRSERRDLNPSGYECPSCSRYDASGILIAK